MNSQVHTFTSSTSSQTLPMQVPSAAISQPTQASHRAQTSANVSRPHTPLSRPPLQPSSGNQPVHQWQSYNSNGLDKLAHLTQTLPQQAQNVPNHIPTRKEADREPWRYRGYPAFCKWIASDDDFFVVRRFGSVSARATLFLQDQVVDLEKQLQSEDDLCKQGLEETADCGRFRLDPSYRRTQIMAELTSALERYQNFILNHSALKSRPNASDFQIRNVKQWLKNANHPIRDEEVSFLDKKDLIPMVFKPRTPFRRFIDRFELIQLSPCIRDRKKNQDLYKAEDFETETTVYIRDALVDKLVTYLIMLLGVGMLIGPLWWLQQLPTGQPKLQARLGIITGFLMLFTILISILTVAKPFEVLAATAAYGAVLMVFMQLGS